MERSPNAELAKRINQAYDFLQKGKSSSQVVDQLMKTYGVSQIQAYRYVHQAKEIKEKIVVPEVSVVFTVKIAPALIARIRKFASSTGMSISKVVSAALEEFLAKRDHGQKREAS
jgi:hypothetical protein